MQQGRIEYIDAMRGVTMILVVYSHVCMFCFGDYFMAFNKVLFLLRLPCFFFISGWLFHKVGRLWDGTTMRQVIRKKFMVQIVPTVIFLALHERTNFFHQLGAFKGGYWFTFALFVFFVLYILTAKLTTYVQQRWGKLLSPQVPLTSGWEWVCGSLEIGLALLISIAAYWYDVSYQRVSPQLGWGRELLGFIGFVTWRYYIFFVLGTLAKKFFDRFLEVTSRRSVQIAVVACFCLMAALPVTDWWPWAYTRFAVSGICGMVMVFTFFRLCAKWLTKEHFLGKSLQYVGTRTLDIYLLHFFFLPEFLLPHRDLLLSRQNPFLEALVVLILALIVLLFSLLASRILRLSPFLAKYLFGVKC